MEFPDESKTKTAIYEKGTASIKPVMNKRISQKIDQDVMDPKKGDLSKRLVPRAAIESRELAEAVNDPVASRRPSMIQTNKIMEKVRSKDDVKKRGAFCGRYNDFFTCMYICLYMPHSYSYLISIIHVAASMSDQDIDDLYKRFSTDLSQDISKEKHNINDMQSRVESITTKFSQLRNENMEMLKVSTCILYTFIYIIK